MKSLTLPLLSLISLTTASPTPDLVARDLSIRNFEESFLSTLTWTHPNNTVKLVGFKRIVMTASQHEDLKLNIRSSPSEWAAFTSAYHDPHESTMRVYFPVENALMYHAGSLVEANTFGEHPHPVLDGDLAVVGRYQTAHVTGVKGNVVRDGVIYLSEPAYPVRRYGADSNILVYDFGWREGAHAHGHGHDHDHDHDDHDNDNDDVGKHIGPRDEGKGGSCKQNHGGRVCSQVYNINHGRCPRDYSSCIDYNGWPIKSCDNHSNKFAFPGSDCFTAVARGHCWNEIPN
ncbi:uncharacterized protein CTRU02_206353 [Colletotrichum truncatum]|uniref:Uncharacterized protein n=1 Tax=Colletotrichum truncatum TaxID=5467 RepID=A0ACC3Z6M0_COLTU|nr:uncharacterized protein CTRU02_09809 [Colletotrichum truncatum]KAF6787996.1 hypothetical protein CTRU02_09809 [Colletotrichum truncatum]